MNILMALVLRKAVIATGTFVATFIPENNATNNEILKNLNLKVDKLEVAYNQEQAIAQPFDSTVISKEFIKINTKIRNNENLKSGNNPDSIPKGDRFKFDNQTGKMLQANESFKSGDDKYFMAYNKFVEENLNSKIIKLAKIIISSNLPQDEVYKVIRVIGMYNYSKSFAPTMVTSIIIQYFISGNKIFPSKTFFEEYTKLYKLVGGDENNSYYQAFLNKYNEKYISPSSFTQKLAENTSGDDLEGLFVSNMDDDVQESQKQLAESQKRLQEALTQGGKKLIKAVRSYVAIGGNLADLPGWDEISKEYNITPDDL